MFKKSRNNPKVVRLSCPFCGAEQSEPVLAISSFCRSCGNHFRIEKGVATAPPGAHVSGISPIDRRPEPEEDTGERQPRVQFPVFEKRTVAPPKSGAPGGQTWLGSIREKTLEQKKAAFSEKTQKVKLKAPVAEKNAPESGPKTEATPVSPPTGQSVTREEATAKGAHSKDRAEANEKPPKKQETGRTPEEKPAGSAAVSKPKVRSEEEPAPESVDPNDLGAAAQPVEQLKGGSMAALLGSALDKLTTETPDAGAEPSPAPPAKMPPGFVPADRRKNAHDSKMRPVRCFECNHRQMVSTSATSTQCARCSVYIRLVDHEINSAWSQNIRTRGNVHVHRKGSVSGCDVACHDLLVQGRFSASVDCSGDAVFKHSAKVIGNMHCKHLIVDKKCDIDFPQGVIAESADVYGTIRGNMTCSGRIRIFKNGSVIGDATARAVVLNDGGVLTGKMSIQPDLEIVLPEKKGYLNQ